MGIEKNEFPLDQWFDLSKKISKYDVETCIAQMSLYAYKDGLDPVGKESREAASELKAAVQRHNAPFVIVEQKGEKSST